MSLSDHPNEEAALKLRMAKRPPPRERPFWYRIFFISLWHGSKNGAASRPSTHHVGYPNTAIQLFYIFLWLKVCNLPFNGF